MITQNALISQTNPCGSFYVQDETVYAISPDTREEYGIALFVNRETGVDTYENLPTLTDLTNPGDDDITGTWTIPISIISSI